MDTVHFESQVDYYLDALSRRMHRLNLLSWKLLNDAQDDEDQISQH